MLARRQHDDPHVVCVHCPDRRRQEKMHRAPTGHKVTISGAYVKPLRRDQARKERLAHRENRNLERRDRPPAHDSVSLERGFSPAEGRPWTGHDARHDAART